MIFLISKLKKYSWLSSRKLIATLLIYDFLSIFISCVTTNILYDFYFIEINEALIIFTLYSSISYIFGRYKMQNSYTIIE